MSRRKARETISLGEYKDSMKGVYSTCISTDTLDEAPGVYKNMKEILDCIQPTCSVVEVIKPAYNFKASD